MGFSIFFCEGSVFRSRTKCKHIQISQEEVVGAKQCFQFTRTFVLRYWHLCLVELIYASTSKLYILQGVPKNYLRLINGKAEAFYLISKLLLF